ncbi:MAG: anaerobic ribonucleoside-triphosphate reductase activating protein [Lachnospiraceae bacterium]|nr:anaerobic ribonucleoside-triphosphate reductase activating protein [Lachnospiraceae bacterium]
MNYCELKNFDVANGPGVRVSLFVSGCTHHCEGCFQPETWDFNYGKPFTEETIEEIIEYLKLDYIKGITLLGGDPLEKSNQGPLLKLLRRIREEFGETKDVWCFTGYEFEKDIIGYMMDEWEDTKELMSYIDILVDGEFELAKKDLMLKFKGSSNQKTIKVKESLASNKIILWDE